LHGKKEPFISQKIYFVRQMVFLFYVSLPLAPMKKKFSILSYVLTMTVLLSMLFQSVHKYEHIAKQLSEIQCVHEKNSTTEITHQHHNFDFCGICAYKLSNFTFLGFATFELNTLELSTKNVDFEFYEITQFFTGSLFALRAPPLV
jgi:hypothetical protein